ncbi:hypothetical protein ONA70_32120 [Micromonospora yasonensis]|uniref:hypothetical protein n=1 Tax=Micromonospora yasonensis TaxID=1128667 RepID=UPI00222EF0A1|nr:hypothetical protein [Micromonospora yasonensis]MCW3844735.1 hypothetical protein [Micromonospora yasonensis]
MPEANSNAFPNFTLVYEGDFEGPIAGWSGYRWILYRDGEYMRRFEARKPGSVAEIMMMASVRISLDTGYDVAKWQPLPNQNDAERYQAVFSAGGD